MARKLVLLILAVLVVMAACIWTYLLSTGYRI